MAETFEALLCFSVVVLLVLTIALAIVVIIKLLREFL